MAESLEPVRKKFGRLELEFRQIRPSDAEGIRTLFHSHSEQTILNRYFTPLRELSPEQLRRFVEVNHGTEEALVGYRPSKPELFLCVGRYMETGVPGEGELAITVHDRYQGRGIGRYLFRELLRLGRKNGLKRLVAFCLAENSSILKLFRSQGLPLKEKREDGIIHFTFEIQLH